MWLAAVECTWYILYRLITCTPVAAATVGTSWQVPETHTRCKYLATRTCHTHQFACPRCNHPSASKSLQALFHTRTVTLLKNMHFNISYTKHKNSYFVKTTHIHRLEIRIHITRPRDQYNNIQSSAHWFVDLLILQSRVMDSSHLISHLKNRCAIINVPPRKHISRHTTPSVRQ